MVLIKNKEIIGHKGIMSFKETLDLRVLQSFIWTLA